MLRRFSSAMALGSVLATITFRELKSRLDEGFAGRLSKARMIQKGRGEELIKILEMGGSVLRRSHLRP